MTTNSNNSGIYQPGGARWIRDSKVKTGQTLPLNASVTSVVTWSHTWSHTFSARSVVHGTSQTCVLLLYFLAAAAARHYEHSYMCTM